MGTIRNLKLPKKLTYMIIGAHPDDADIEFGGTAILLKELGHHVIYVSMTNGDAGHQTMDRKSLATRRRKEAAAVADFLDIEYIVSDNHDGELIPSIENREKLIRLIRIKKPNVIITNRPNDYHADHRATSILVQDAAYLVAVPSIVRDTPRLEYNPFIFYHQDSFQKPNPFTPNVIVDISDVIDKKMEALAFHESQVFEWLPFIENREVPTPLGDAGKIAWLKEQYGNPSNVGQFINLLKDNTKHIEALEKSEYGGDANIDVLNQIFPFGYYF